MKVTKELKTNKGITLIALVITIIVMLILVGVTISMAVNGGLFEYAGRAAKETNDALKAEQQLAEGGLNVAGEWYSSIDEYLNKDKERISKETNYVGYYADVDGNGTVDGVIYADLAFTKEVSWSGKKYSYIAETDLTTLKNYYVSKTNYEGVFGTKDVLAPVGTGKDRFYVMALEDAGNYCWYENSVTDDYDSLVTISTSPDFGQGNLNTQTMLEKWKISKFGEKSNRDVWSLFESSSNSKWFLPSLGEWIIFYNAFTWTPVVINQWTDPIDGGTYYEYGPGFGFDNGQYLNSYTYKGEVEYIYFQDGKPYSYSMPGMSWHEGGVRLSTTF